MAETWVLNSSWNCSIVNPAQTVTINGTMYGLTPYSQAIESKTFTKFLFTSFNNGEIGAVQFVGSDGSYEYSNSFTNSFASADFVYLTDSDFWDSKSYSDMTDDEKLKFRTVTFDTAPTGELLTWLQANGTKKPKLSVDLTTLSGWANLAPGNHTIKIVAKGTGYRDSEKSAAVEVTKAAEVYTDCLTFTGETSEFTLKATDKDWDGTLEWSTDHNTWTTLEGTEEMQSVGKKLYLRGKENTTFGAFAGVQWQLSANAGCSGNIQTLLDWENPPTSILDSWCYSSMFNGCTNLTTSPELPATNLSQHCYREMFQGCINLTTAPKLPATTLEKGCYQSMFYGCSKLKVNTSSGNKIFTCPATIPDGSVNNMFGSTVGTFTGTPTAGNTYYWTE